MKQNNIGNKEKEKILEERIRVRYFIDTKKRIPFSEQAYHQIHDSFFEFTKGWRTIDKEGYYKKDFWGYLQDKLKELENITIQESKKEFEELKNKNQELKKILDNKDKETYSDIYKITEALNNDMQNKLKEKDDAIIKLNDINGT